MLDVDTLRRNKIDASPYGDNALDGEIVTIRRLTSLESIFTIRARRNGKVVRFGAQPGQFANIGLTGMKVPISVTSMPEDHDGECFDLAIRNASGGSDGQARLGGVTHLLHKLKVGDHVDIEGPMGHGYPLAELCGQDIILIKSGIGYFPLRSLERHILAHREDYGRLFVFFGIKYSSENYFPEEVTALEDDPSVHFQLAVSREENWPGYKGRVTGLVQALDIPHPSDTVAVLCGPDQLFRDICPMLTGRGLRADKIHMSMENPMSCMDGNPRGYCGRCAQQGVLICKEGPVISYERTLRQQLWR